MFKNYLKITLRTLLKNKFFTLINVLGLAVGISACLFITQYVVFESTFDNFHRDADHIYRISHTRIKDNVVAERSATTFAGLAEALDNDFPEVQAATSIYSYDCILSTKAENDIVSYKEDNVFWVDESFFDVFTFPLVKGTEAGLKETNAVMITERTAKKFFGKQDPIGKTMRVLNYNQGLDFEGVIRGVLKELPGNSHLQFSAIFTSRKPYDKWNYADNYAYAKLVPEAKPGVLESKLPGFLQKYKDNQDSGNAVKLSLQPLKSIHLYSDLTKEIGVNGNGKLVWFMILIAFLILLIAFVNYINLSTIKAIDRAKEVGLRKTFGSNRKSLMVQFVWDAFILNFVSIVLAIVMVMITHDLFYKYTEIKMTLDFWASPWVWLSLVLLLILGSFISGIYPAYLLSSYDPIQVLKGNLPIGSNGLMVRKSLVVFQFVISIFLIIGVFTISKQLNYMRQRDLGMDLSQNIIVASPSKKLSANSSGGSFYQRVLTFQSKLLDFPKVENVTSSSSIPGIEIDWTRPYQRKGANQRDKNYYATFAIGPEFLEQFKVRKLAGKNFTKTMSSRERLPGGSVPIMINEAAVKAFGFENPKAAVGEFLIDKNGSGMVFEYEIIGVVQNFHQESLKETYTPIVFRLEDGSSVEYYAIKVNTTGINETLANIEGLFDQLFPESPFEFFFLDEFFNRQYKKDQQFGRVFGLFAGLAIFITCLGLLGLSFFTSFQRSKEISIRKVLGSSSFNILLLLLQDFIKLIVFASIIAIPISWWGLGEWLQSYPFQISFNYFLFILAPFIVFGIAFIIVGLQTWQIERNDPLKAIRSD